jgi:hypothetical protein
LLDERPTDEPSPSFGVCIGAGRIALALFLLGRELLLLLLLLLALRRRRGRDSLVLFGVAITPSHIEVCRPRHVIRLQAEGQRARTWRYCGPCPATCSQRSSSSSTRSSSAAGDADADEAGRPRPRGDGRDADQGRRSLVGGRASRPRSGRTPGSAQGDGDGDLAAFADSSTGGRSSPSRR